MVKVQLKDGSVHSFATVDEAKAFLAAVNNKWSAPDRQKVATLTREEWLLRFRPEEARALGLVKGPKRDPKTGRFVR